MTLEKILPPCKNGFRPKRSTTQQILAIGILCGTAAEYQSSAITIAFVAFAKAFDSVKWNYLETILRLYGIPEQLIRAILSLYNGAQARVRTQDSLTDPFYLTKGVLQGDTLAPYLFVIIMDWVLRTAIPDSSLAYVFSRGARRKPGIYITDLDYADDIAIVGKCRDFAS